MKLFLKQKRVIFVCLLLQISFFICNIHKVYAVFTEQVAMSAKAISLGNACTADPPGLMSAHYNPAGLSLLDDGKVFSQGFTFAHIRRTGRFKADPDWEGLMNNTWGPGALYNPDDPLRQHGGPDPLAEQEGTNSKNVMYFPVPVIGPLELPALPATTLGISSRKKNSKLTVAYANYAPFGGGMVHDDTNDPYEYSARFFYSQHFIIAAPTASYAVSDQLSVGVSVGIGQRAFGLQVYNRAPNELVALTRVIGDATRKLEIPGISEQTLPPPWQGGGLGPYSHDITLTLNDLRDDFVPSYNLGLLWSPKNWFRLGLAYQSEMKAEVTGEYKWSFSEQYQKTVDWNGSTPMTLQTAGMLDLPYAATPSQTGTVTGTDILPQFFHIGIMLRPIKKLKILHDWHWGNWSVLKENNFQFDQRIQLLRTAKLLGWSYGANNFVVDRSLKDTWHWSLGIEYQVKDDLKVRMGYERRPTSLNEDLMDTLLFLPDATLYGMGIELKKKEGITVDLSLGCLLADTLKLSNNTSTNFNSNDFTKLGNTYNGLDYEQDAAIYLLSLGLTMPLEVQIEQLHHQTEMMKHSIKKLKKLLHKLNPFSKKTKDREKVDTKFNEKDKLKNYIDKISKD